MRRVALIVAVIGLIALACWSTDFARAITFGWAQFLARVVPRLTWDRNAVLLAATALALFTVGVHWLGRAWSRWRHSDHTWKLGWSVAVSAVVVVAFAAGICMIGVVHQTGWLLAAGEPLIVEREQAPHGYASSKMNIPVLAFGLINSYEANGRFLGGSRTDDTVLHSWATYALMMSNYSLSNEKGERLDLERPWDDPKNQKFFRGVIPILVNPSLRDAPLRDASGFGLAHYAANSRAMANGVFRPLSQFADGTANTLLIGEVNANFRPWGDPANVRDPSRGVNRSPYGFGGPLASGGALFGMADGSVRFVSERVSPAVLKALATPEGGEVIEPGVLQEP